MALAAVGAVACTGPGGNPDDGPRPLRVYRLELQESESVYVSRPTSLLRAGSSWFVADMFQNRILEFDGGSGRPTATIAGPGGGPGEFKDVGDLFALGDTVIGAVDLGRGLFTLFDRHTGAFLRSRPYEGRARAIVPRPEAVYFGNMNVQRGTAVGAWHLDSDSMAYWVPLAPEYSASPELAGMYSGAEIDSWGDTLLLAMGGLNRLEWYALEGTPLTALEVPVTRRRGSSPEIIAELTFRAGKSFEDTWGRASAVLDLRRAPDGRVHIIHGDQRLQVQGRRITGTYYVSVLAADRRRACVDGLLDVTRDAQPVFAFNGDTLFILEQRVGDGTAVRTTVSGYVLDTSSCRWLDVTPSVPRR
jgi:hypothetical protein